MAQEDQMGWQRQNMKKTGPQTLSVGSMHPKLDCGCTVKKYADGGAVDEATLKAEGLAASNAERETLDQNRSFGEKLMNGLKRFTQGNIDDPSSEAYHEYGAGRGQRERNAKMMSDEQAAINATQTANTAIADATPTKKYDMGEFEGVDDAIARNKTTAAPAPAKAEAPAPVKKSIPAPTRDARDAEAGQSRGSRSFSADVAERKSKAPASAASDTSFDPMKLNFANSTPVAKPVAQEDKNKARPITRSRAYYSGKS